MIAFALRGELEVGGTVLGGAVGDDAGCSDVPELRQLVEGGEDIVDGSPVPAAAVPEHQLRVVAEKADDHDPQLPLSLWQPGPGRRGRAGGAGVTACALAVPALGRTRARLAGRCSPGGAGAAMAGLRPRAEEVDEALHTIGLC